MAVKRLELGSPAAAARARREVELLRLGAHPLLAPVLDADLDGEVPYLVLPLYRGGDLRTALEEAGPRPEGEVVEVGRRVAAALAHLHDLGIVHRDVKPENLLRDAGGAVVLADLGLGKAESHGDVTRTAEVPGTEPYLACERLGGAPATPPSDVFALGVTLVELLTGLRPSVGPGEVRLPPDLAARASPGLVRELRRALHRDPSARPSARELAGHLAALQLPSAGSSVPGDTTVDAGCVPVETGPRRGPRPEPLPGRTGARGARTGAALGLLLLGLLAAWTRAPSPPPPARGTRALGEPLPCGGGGRVLLRPGEGPERALEVVVEPREGPEKVLRVSGDAGPADFLLRADGTGWILELHREDGTLVLAGTPAGELLRVESPRRRRGAS